MQRPLALLAALAAPGIAAIPAGGCTGSGNVADASTDGTVIPPASDAEGDDGGSDVTEAISTMMRLANMSPDLGPVDFCWRVTGAGSFTGPVIGGSLDAGGRVPLDAPIDAKDGSVFGGDAGAGGSIDASDEPDVAEEASEASPDDGSAGDGPGDGLDEEVSAPADAAGDVAEEAGAEGGNASEDASDGEAGPPPQVAFGSVSAFKQLPAIGTLDIALVEPNQLSCGSPEFIGRVTLDPGKSATVTVMGFAGSDAGPSALVMKAFVDEPTTPQIANVRFVHAALGWPGADGPAPPLKVQAGNAVLAPEIDPASVSSPSASPMVDALGYTAAPTTTSPAPIEIFSAGDAAGRTWSTPFFDLELLPGTSHTGFIVDLGSGALGIAWCGVAQTGTVAGSCELRAAR